MLPFSVRLAPGAPIYEQIVRAAKRAVVSGVLPAGARFPAVRAISEELGVNPNTAQKAVAELTAQGLIEVRPGQGCFVAERQRVGKGEALRVIAPLAEQLLVEAERVGLPEAELLKFLQTTRRKML
ncbi:MAG: GntR family transcriptional regulator [Verrucomicrobiales bacterium]|jgi:GntR family transcriptional regulator|nr:GntR family transcriptional regulator [Verrucomicrobiales bacterium]